MKSKLLQLLGLLYLIINSQYIFAKAEYSPHFRKINVNTGLSESSVYCILQDSKGYMWFGTKDGLNKYDGNSFRIFKGVNSNQADSQTLQNNFIRCLIQGNDSTIFIGTDAGLYVMNRLHESITYIDTKQFSDYQITSAITSLMEDKNGNIWIGTMLQGLYLYNPTEQTLQKIIAKGHKLEQKAIWAIYEDLSGDVWVGTRGGLLKYNKQKKKLEAIENMFYDIYQAEHEVLSICEDPRGYLWLGMWDDGLRMYDKKNNRYQSFYNKDTEAYHITHIRTLYCFSTNTILIGSDDGLYEFNTETKEIQRIDKPHYDYSLSDQSIYSIAKDREGGIWIGTYFGGVNYLPPSGSKIETYKPSIIPFSLSGKAVSQFCEAPNGNLWIGTEDGGLNFLDVQTKKITQPVKTSYHNLHALLMDDTDLWIGTFSRGIDIYNTRTGQLRNIQSTIDDEKTIDDNCVFSLYKTRSNDIYIGTTIGLCRYDRKSNSFIRIQEVRAFVYDIKEDETGNLWVATYGTGIKKREANTGKWIDYNQIKTIEDQIVNAKLISIYIDQQKRLFITSEGRGLFQYDYNTDSFTNITEADGLPNNVVYGILDDEDGNLWMSTNKGIAYFSSDLKNKKLYTVEDGLQSNQYNFKSFYKSRDGKLYFGGVNGFNCFYPSDLREKENRTLPSADITRFSLLADNDKELSIEIDQALKTSQKIVLPHNKASFSISYICLSYVAEPNNQYAYRLLNADKKWIFVGNNKTVTYVNLAPGEYEFQVKASNNDGVWNEEASSIQIKILPPLWLTTGAKISYLIIASLLIAFVIRFYVKKRTEKHKRQMHRFKREQETKAYKSKISFFTAIAHEIRTPLSLIRAPLEEIIHSKDGNESTKYNLSIIERNSNQLTELIDRLLNLQKMDSIRYKLNPEKVNLYTITYELYERFKITCEKKRIDFSLKASSQDLIVNTDVSAYQVIISNLLTNAIKFTQNKIIIDIEQKSANTYTVSIEDNGIGIPDKEKAYIFNPFYQTNQNNKNGGTGVGLYMAKQFSDILDGSLEVIDAIPSGTIFKFSFPNITQTEPNHPKEIMINLSEEVENDAKTVETVNTVQKENNRPTILVVDDNVEIVSYLENSLKEDYLVYTAHSAHEAFNLLKNDVLYDLIISDIMMPEIDGISFTKTIKSDSELNHIPIILLSAKTENSTKVEGLNSGADLFIEKPFSILFLKAQIQSLFKNRKKLIEIFNKKPFATYKAEFTSKNDKDFLKRVDIIIELQIADDSFSVESLAEQMGVSRSLLQRKLKRICQITPNEYIRDYKLKRACLLLLEKDIRINEVAFRVGFGSASYFTKVFTKVYGISPKEFINEHTENI